MLTDSELLRFLGEERRNEQEFFWQRFYAFATLHAGAFVLMTSTAIADKALLATFWRKSEGLNSLFVALGSWATCTNAILRL
jgi:hypothetical protein